MMKINSKSKKKINFQLCTNFYRPLRCMLVHAQSQQLTITKGYVKPLKCYRICYTTEVFGEKTITKLYSLFITIYNMTYL
jgi:hypothetical protein